MHIVHNWNWEPVRVPVPAAMTDVLTGAAVEADATLRLGAWDVHILVSDEPEPR